MNALKISSLTAGLLLLAACVTINIYFPTSEAEEAARTMVQDILGNESEESPPAEDNGAALDRPVHVRLSESVLDFFIPAAHAADEPDFTVDTPEIRKIQARMKQRHQELKPFYNTGSIGYTRSALVAPRNLTRVPIKERGKVMKMIDKENKDRNALYKAIAEANGHPEWEQSIRNTYAVIWVEEASTGWWFENAKGRWARKP